MNKKKISKKWNKMLEIRHAAKHKIPSRSENGSPCRFTYESQKVGDRICGIITIKACGYCKDHHRQMCKHS